MTAFALCAMAVACHAEPAPTPGDRAVAERRRAQVVDGVSLGFSDAGARYVRTIAGFNGPESVRYDAEQDAYFVSNIFGLGSAKDGNGYIVRVEASDLSRTGIFVQGGRDGVTLNAPKGMAIQGDTLWVADIDVVRGFDRRGGRPVGTIDFAAFHPTQLNDVAVGPDGTLRVTDTGIQMVRQGNLHVGGDRVFAVDTGRRVRVVAEGLALRQPNGVTWDPARGQWIVVSFDPFVGEVATLADGGARAVLHTTKGRLDGVEAVDGTLLYTSWADSSLHRLTRDGRDVQFIREVPEPADIGWDSRRRQVLIPLATMGWVQIWRLEE